MFCQIPEMFSKHQFCRTGKGSVSQAEQHAPLLDVTVGFAHLEVSKVRIPIDL
jgi:hypothetical protein